MLKRKILALLLLTCLCATFLVAPSAHAAPITFVNGDDRSTHGTGYLRVDVTADADAAAEGDSVSFTLKKDGNTVRTGSSTISGGFADITFTGLPSGNYKGFATCNSASIDTGGTFSVTGDAPALLFTNGNPTSTAGEAYVKLNVARGEPVTLTAEVGGVVKATAAGKVSSGTTLEHTFSGLAAGTYKVRAVYDNFGSVSDITGDINVGGAAPVLAPLHFTHGHSNVAGQLYVRLEGTASQNVKLSLQLSDGTEKQVIASTAIGAGGALEYTFTNLITGTYKVKATYVSDTSISDVTGNVDVTGASTAPGKLNFTHANGTATLGDLYARLEGTASAKVNLSVLLGSTVKKTINNLSVGTNGVLEYTFTDLPTGTYKVKAVFATDSTVTATSGNVDITGKTYKLTITKVSLAGRDQIRVIGTGAPGGLVRLDLLNGPSKNITIGSDGKYDEIITSIPEGTYAQVTASYYGDSTAYDKSGTYPIVYTTGGPWVVKDQTDTDITINAKPTVGVGTVTVTGKAKPNSYVTAFIGSYNGGKKADANGNYSITITLPAGTYTGVEVKYDDPSNGNNASLPDKIVVPDGTTPPPTTNPTGGSYPTLQRGDINSYVTTLQQYLQSLGYYTIRVDGIFGVGTQTAVRNFQIMNNLPATGIADDATQKKLYSGTAIGIGGNNSGTGDYGTLRFGSRGTAVRTLQTRLANLRYYYGSIDGIFGSQSEAAVRNFQSRNNLAVTGVADSATQTAVFSSSALANSDVSSGYVYLHYGSRGAAVTRLQTALKNAGYYNGAIDGQYYDQTYAAVKKFQRAQGLVVDGIAGKQTQNKLYGTNY